MPPSITSFQTQTYFQLIAELHGVRHGDGDQSLHGAAEQEGAAGPATGRFDLHAHYAVQICSLGLEKK